MSDPAMPSPLTCPMCQAESAEEAKSMCVESWHSKSLGDDCPGTFGKYPFGVLGALRTPKPPDQMTFSEIADAEVDDYPEKENEMIASLQSHARVVLGLAE